MGFRHVAVRRLVAATALGVATLAGAEPQQPSQPGEIWRLDVRSSGRNALALPPFAAKGANAEAPAAMVSRILEDDIAFASVFRLVPEERIRGLTFRPLDYVRWEGAGADVAVFGELSVEGGKLVADVAIHDVVGAVPLFVTRYSSATGSPRELAHYIADRVLDMFGIQGVARTKIAFASDREGGNKAIYIMDYDGNGQRPLTRNRHLDFQPRVSPDDEILSFISYPRKNAAPVLAVLNGEPLFSGPGMIFSAEWSPDGTRIAFSATRDEPGNAEVYVMNRDGTGVRRLTHHPSIDVSPTWSPTGRELAFASDRTGSPQIYVMDAEGLNLRRVSSSGSYNAEPAWSPSTDVSEIAYASRSGGGNFDIVVLDLEARRIRVLTSNEGINESPRFAPSGRHLVFTSTRTGTPQIFTMNRDGSNPKQLTFEGENVTPSWGPRPSEP